MTKLLIALGGAGLAALATVLAVALGDTGSRTPTLATNTATTTRTATVEERREAGEDVRGPCDEAEHANDPRCTGIAATGDDRSGPGGREHDDDADEDHSGPGRGSDDDDRSGCNSGRG
jgi:hypothetical protein